MATARNQSLSINMVMNSAIKGANFLQVSVNKLHTYAKKVENINLLKKTKFPLLKRNLSSLENHLGKIRSTSAKIAANPIKINIDSSRTGLKEVRKDMTDIERSAKQTAFYSKKNEENLRRGAQVARRAGCESAERAQRSSRTQKQRRDTSAGAVMGTAMALAPMVMPLKASFDFEEAITSVEAKTDTAFAKDIPLLRANAMKLGASTEWTMPQVAKGQEYLTMAGFNPKQINEAMRGNLALATVGDLDLGTSSDISSNILTGYGKKASDMNRVADVMAKTITTSNVNITEMGESMKYVGTVATALRGKDAFLETTAMVGLLGNAGIKGTQAGTHLKGMYTRMAAPPKQAKEALGRLGVTAFDKSGKAKPMHELIGDLNKKFKEKNYSDQRKTEALKHIFGMIALPSAMALLAVGEDKIVKYQEKINKSKNEAERIQKMKLDTPYGQLKLLGSAMSGLAITMTSQIIPPFKEFTGVLTQGVNTVQTWAKANPKLSAGIYAVGIGVGVLTVGLMTLGLVSTLAGKGLQSMGLLRTKRGVDGVAGATRKATIAQTAFNIATRANPFILIGTLLAGAYFAFNDMNAVMEFGKGTVLGLNDGFNALKETLRPVGEIIITVSDHASDLAEKFGFAGWKSKEAGDFGFKFGQMLPFVITGLLGAKVAVGGLKMALGGLRFGLGLLIGKNRAVKQSVGLAASAFDQMRFSAQKPVNHRVGVQMPKQAVVKGRFASILSSLAQFAKENPITLIASVAVIGGLGALASEQKKRIDMNRPTLSKDRAEVEQRIIDRKKRLEVMKGGGNWWERSTEFLLDSPTEAKIKQQEKLLKADQRRLGQLDGTIPINKPSIATPVKTYTKEQISEARAKAFDVSRELGFTPTELPVESISGMTDQMIKQAQSVTLQDQKQVQNTYHNTYHIDAKDKSPEEIVEIMKQYDLEKSHADQDTQLQDVI